MWKDVTNVFAGRSNIFLALAKVGPSNMLCVGFHLPSLLIKELLPFYLRPPWMRSLLGIPIRRRGSVRLLQVVVVELQGLGPSTIIRCSHGTHHRG